MYRTICSLKLENCVYRRRYNFELEEEFDRPCVINLVKTNRLRYAGHMIRRPEDLPQKVIFKARPQGMSRQGSPKSSWADGVNSDNRAFEAQDWTNQAQDREQWKELLWQTITAILLWRQISKWVGGFVCNVQPADTFIACASIYNIQYNIYNIQYLFSPDFR
jgi:hypothetical protein